MHNIANNRIITLTAGDSFIAPLYLFSEESKYYVDKNDTIYFVIMEPNQDFNDAIVRKVYTMADTDVSGNLIIQLDPEDTENLRPGIYYYEIKMRIMRGNKEYIDTVSPKRKLYII